MLLSHVHGGWTDARAFEELFDPDVIVISGMTALVPRCSMVVEDLMLLSNDDLATRPLGAFQKLALWLLRDVRDPVHPLNSFDVWIPSMLELIRTRTGLDRFHVLITYLFQMIDPMHLDALRAKLRKLGSHTEEGAMTIAEYFHEEGRKKGLEEGCLEAMTIAEYFHEEAARKAASPRCAACSSSSSSPSVQKTRLDCIQRHPRRSTAIYNAC